MPKRLTLIRHAKSSWENPGQADADRPLNKRGEYDAPMMGKRLLARGARPSLIITSSAKRAAKTAKLIARELGYPKEFIQREPKLYLAEPRHILEVIAEQDNGFNDMFVIGHNPGMTELAVQLSGMNIDNVPTCGIVALQAEVENWSALTAGGCQLDFFDYPKKRGESDRP